MKDRSVLSKGLNVLTIAAMLFAMMPVSVVGAYDEGDLEYVIANTTLTGTLSELTATFPPADPESWDSIILDSFKINSKMTLAGPLPEGTTITIMISVNGSDFQQYVTDEPIPGQVFWVTDLFDGVSPSDFDEGYVGRVEIYNITINEPPGVPFSEDFKTTVLIQSIISDDNFATEIVLADITLPIANDAPSFTSTPVISVTEDKTYTYNIAATDPDTGDTLTFSATTKPDWLALTDNGGGTAILTGTPTSLDIGDHTVELVVTDSSSATGTQSFSIHVNDAPEITGQATALTTMEETPLEITLANLTVVDSDNAYPTDFTLIVLEGMNYSLVGNTITPALDFAGTLTVPVKVNDGLADSNTFNLSVSVTNVNDAPTDITLIPSSVAENQPSGTVVGTFSTTDVDAGETFSYAFVTGTGDTDNMSFTIDVDVLKTAAVFDFETKSSYSIRVESTDSGGLPVEETFTITVTAENDAPVVSDIPDQTITEGETFATIILDNYVSDVDNLDSEITWSYSGNTELTVDITAQVATITIPDENWNGAETITFRATDLGALYDEDAATFTVTGVNDAPVITGQETLSTAEETALLITLDDLIVTDVDNTYPDDFTLTVLTGTNYTLVGNTITPVLDFTGTLTVPVKVNDGTTDSNTYNLSVSVTNVNDAPVITGQETLSTAEETALEITFADLIVTDVDNTYPTGFTLTVLTGTNYTLVGNTITPVLDFTGTLTVPVKVNDGTTDSNTYNLSVSVTNVNDAPVITGQETLSTAEETALLITLDDLIVTDVDNTYPDDFTLTVLTGTNYTLVGNTITPVLDFTGTLTVPVKVNDGTTDSNTYNLSVSVTNVNDAPVLGSIGNKTIDELKELSFTATATDIDDGDTLTYGLVNAPSGAAINATTGVFTWTPTETQGPGSHSFTVEVCDDGVPSLCDQELITVTVNEVNVAPILTSIGAKNVDEETPLSFTALASDADNPEQALTFSLVDEPEGTLIDSETGAFTWTPTEAQGPGTYTFDVCVSDGVTSVCETITVTVNDVNEEPVLASIGTKSVDELLTLTFTASGTDTDFPTQTLSYSLVGAPEGAAIDPVTGVFSWTPTEAQGPDDYIFDVCVSDGDLSDCETITVTVNEINVDPILTSIGSKTVDELVPLSFTALASDEDIPVQDLTFSLVGAPTGATIDPVTDAFTWTPTEAQGPDDYTFAVCVSDGVESVCETITVTVYEVNVAPVANNQSASTNEDVERAITLTASDADIPVQTLIYTVVGGPYNGTLEGTAPNLTYTPDLNYNGSDIFTFEVTDGALTSALAFVSINIIAVNDAPVANAQTVTVVEDTPKSITLTGSDVDEDGLTFTVLTQPSHGTLSGTAPSLTYTPNLNYNGPDSFTFKVNDGQVDSNTATVTINVTAVNDAPVADDQTVPVIEDTPIIITLTGSDVDDGDTLTYAVVDEPSHGTLSGTAPNLTYTPSLNYNGPDSFTFKANDGAFDSNIATISITVDPFNDAPVADDDAYSAPKNQTYVVPAPGVLGNDDDVDGDSLSVSSYTQPGTGKGTVVVGADGSVSYNPPTGFLGLATFTYTVSDGSLTDVGTVTINVYDTNQQPTAINLDPATLAENQSPGTEIGQLTTVDPDPLDVFTYTFVPGDGDDDNGLFAIDGNMLVSKDIFNYETAEPSYSIRVRSTDQGGLWVEQTFTITITDINDAPVANPQSVSTDEEVPLSITLTGSDEDGDEISFLLISAPTHGSMPWTPPNLVYTPNENYFGPDSFTIKADDGTLTSITATITITVNNVNDIPVADDKTVNTNEDTSVGITLTGSDVEGSALTFAVVGGSGPAHGTLSGDLPNLTYTPDANYYGPDSFQYIANDGTDDSLQATVSITVNPVNDTPVADDKTVETDEDIAVGITLTGSDVEGSPLTFAIVADSGLDHGTLSGTGSTLTYTPDPNYNGPDSFQYTANDGSKTSLPATVSITVNAVNDAPVAVDDTATINEDTPLVIDASILLEDDTDVEGDTLSLTAVSTPINGTVVLVGTTITFTPTTNFNGTASFDYTISDGNGGTDTGLVTITVNPVNDTPVVEGIPDQTIAEGSTFATINLDLYVTDVDNTDVQMAWTYTGNSQLAVSIVNRVATITIPDVNWNGAETITFRATDPGTSFDEDTATFTVTPVNDAPVALGQSVVTDEDQSKAITLEASDVDGDPLSWHIVTPPAHGILQQVSGANWTYLPEKDYHGPDSFTFKVNDGKVDSNTATVTITVKSVNDAPEAVDQTVTVYRGYPAAITLEASDVDGDDLLWAILTPPANGTLSGTAPDLIYTPDDGTFTTDSFTFRVTEDKSGGVSDTGTVAITVVDPACLTVDPASLSMTLEQDQVDTLILSLNNSCDYAVPFELEERDILLTEGFESGVMPPAGWSTIHRGNTIEVWKITFNETWVYEGDYAAWIFYDDNKASDEWLLTPTINTSAYSDLTLSFMAYSDTEYAEYATVKLWVTDVDGNPLTAEPLWDLADEEWPTTAYHPVLVDLSAFDGYGQIRIAWQYVGQAGQNFGLDKVRLDYESPVSWLSQSPQADVVPASGSFDVTVTFDSTGLSLGSYDVKIEIPSHPSLSVPTRLLVVGGEGFEMYLPLIVR